MIAQILGSNKSETIFGIFFIAFIFGFLILFSKPDLFDKQRNLELKYLEEPTQQVEYINLLFHLMDEKTINALSDVNDALSNLPPAISVDSDTKLIFADFSNRAKLYFRDDTPRLPSDSHVFPQFPANTSSLSPIYHSSKNRTGVSIVIGVPTVKRENQSYLLVTLNDLIEKMSSGDKEDTLIVVFIAEIDQNSALEIANDIKSVFGKELESGLIDIISPHASFYPDWDQVPVTLSDSKDRVIWRSKQCLDFAFLMTYSQVKGHFYVQLEDDVLTKPNYVSTMKAAAVELSAENKSWFLLDFCYLGFIGKMFRCNDLPKFIQFLFLFFNEKPIDWLIYDFLRSENSNLTENDKNTPLKDKLFVRFADSLFQHIGTISSLKGKIQMLKDKSFGTPPLFYPHGNPPANVHSSIKPFEDYLPNKAYEGESFFWGVDPKPGDWISIIFEKPVRLKRFLFRSGNAENPLCLVTNASVLASFISGDSISSKDERVIGEFNKLGKAEGSFSDAYHLVREIKLVLHGEALNWIILSEILIEEFQN